MGFDEFYLEIYVQATFAKNSVSISSIYHQGLRSSGVG